LSVALDCRNHRATFADRVRVRLLAVDVLARVADRLSGRTASCARLEGRRRLVGLDDSRLTRYHAGRFEQLTQFGGKPIDELIAWATTNIGRPTRNAVTTAVRVH